MRVAGLDLGTNTFILLIAEAENGDISQVLHDEVRIVRLGEGVAKANRLGRSALIRAEQCLAEFSQTIKRFNVDRVLACATSAARDAENGDELDLICRRHQIPLTIIDGEKEAEYTFRGTTDLSAHASSQVPKVIIDVGGGSTEFIFSLGALVISRFSIDVGAVRLTEQLVSQNPIPIEERALLRREIQLKIKEGLRRRPDGEQWKKAMVIAVAGTPSTLASLTQGLPFESGRVDHFRISMQVISSWVERLAGLSVTERQALPGMDKNRADVIVAGAMILEEACRALPADELEVSVKGLRYGIVKELASR